MGNGRQPSALLSLVLPSGISHVLAGASNSKDGEKDVKGEA
jgi:hypothetical protein